jgi:hypothetical protein
MILMPITFIIFFILSSFYIWKKSQIFFLAYSALFAYTIFTQLGYLFYPEILDIVSFHQYYGKEAFIPYWIYIFLSFIAIFLIFIRLYEKKYKTMLKLEIKPLLKKSHIFLYLTLIFFYESFLIFFLVKNYENLSYFTQFVLKDNKLWSYLFTINGIILLSLFYKIYTTYKKNWKVFYIILFILSVSVFLITAIKGGQRIEMAATLLGFIVFLGFVFKDKIKNKGRILKYGFIILFIAVLLFQGIRTTRGGQITIEMFLENIKNPEIYLSLFLPKNLIFQDWLSPSLTLITSMEQDIVFPSKVIESNLRCLVPFISHQSLGEILARIINPESRGGYGYYILNEGYNFMGFAGFIYSAFIFVLGFRLLESFFASTKDKLFNAYMYGIIAFLIIDIVRGQSIGFLKGLYFYFLPAIILFILMSRKRIYLARPKMGIKVIQK